MTFKWFLKRLRLKSNFLVFWPISLAMACFSARGTLWYFVQALSQRENPMTASVWKKFNFSAILYFFCIFVVISCVTTQLASLKIFINLTQLFFRQNEKHNFRKISAFEPVKQQLHLFGYKLVLVKYKIMHLSALEYLSHEYFPPSSQSFTMFAQISRRLLFNATRTKKLARLETFSLSWKFNSRFLAQKEQFLPYPSFHFFELNVTDRKQLYCRFGCWKSDIIWCIYMGDGYVCACLCLNTFYIRDKFSHLFTLHVPDNLLILMMPITSAVRPFFGPLSAILYFVLVSQPFSSYICTRVI